MHTDNTNSDQNLRRVEIPRVINLGGQSYSINENPVLKDLVDKIRQDTAIVEKSKLYPAINKLKEKAEQLSHVEVTSNAGQAPESAINAENLVDQVVSRLEKKFQPLLDSTEQNRIKDLETYREKVLRENEGKCIPEMVVGTSREEIDESLSKSKGSFEKVKTQFGITSQSQVMGQQSNAAKTQAQTANQQNASDFAKTTTSPVNQQQAVPNSNDLNGSENGQQVATPIVLPSSPASTQFAEKVPTNIGTMSQEEFSKQRDDLFKEITDITANNVN